jgi:hypothetical protein
MVQSWMNAGVWLTNQKEIMLAGYSPQIIGCLQPMVCSQEAVEGASERGSGR